MYRKAISCGIICNVCQRLMKKTKNTRNLECQIILYVYILPHNAFYFS